MKRDTTKIGLNAVDVVPMHERVYQEIVEALMSGRIHPGQKVTSRTLARELGTSDMPVRAALTRLQSLRALEQRPNGTLALPNITRETLESLMDARQLCEGAAAERAAKLVTAKDLQKIRKEAAALTEAARAQDIDDYLLRNYNFKFSVYQCCGSKPLLFLIEILWMQVGPFLRNFAAGQFGGDLSGILEIDYHEDVVSALEAREGIRARKAIQRDIAEGCRYLVKNAAFD